MMIFQKNLAELALAIIIFIITASDFYKGILMIFGNKTPLLFMAQVSFLLLKLMPVSIQNARVEDAMNTYKERRKIYGFFALIGGPWGILLSLLIFNKLAKPSKFLSPPQADGVLRNFEGFAKA